MSYKQLCLYRTKGGQVVGRGTRLRLTGVSTTDSGLYTCSVSGCGGTTEVTCQVCGTQPFVFKLPARFVEHNHLFSSYLPGLWNTTICFQVTCQVCGTQPFVFKLPARFVEHNHLFSSYLPGLWNTTICFQVTCQVCGTQPFVFKLPARFVEHNHLFSSYLPGLWNTTICFQVSCCAIFSHYISIYITKLRQFS